MILKRLILVLILAPMVALASPASITELTIDSHGQRLPGLIYQAAGVGPHPTVILLHGYPGNEKNLDVAQEVRKKGWNAVYFNYRGAWGAEGEFSFRNSEQDVQSVLKFLQMPKNAKGLRVDPDNIVLVGHSMGGHMAIAGLLDNLTVKCAIAYDGANLGAKGKGLFADAKSEALWKDYSDSLFMLSGWSGNKAVAEISTYGKELDLTKRASRVNGRPVLLLSADTEVIPEKLHILPLQAALSSDKGHQTEYRLIDDDHSFSSSRDKLIEATVTFLNNKCL